MSQTALEHSGKTLSDQIGSINLQIRLIQRESLALNNTTSVTDPLKKKTHHLTSYKYLMCEIFGPYDYA